MTKTMSDLEAEIAQHDSWLCVKTDALRSNAAALKNHLHAQTGASPQLLAVVKANGYGHGAGLAARAFREGGATWFGVTTMAEAKELVDAGIVSSETPILVFAPAVASAQIIYALENDLHLTVCDKENADQLGKVINTLGKKLSVHLKVDTGMGRLGLRSEAALSVAKTINGLASITLVGVYTHFATANDKDLSKTKKQLHIFEQFCSELDRGGITNLVRHCANSSAMLRLPECRLDMVRAGTVLYGQSSSQFSPKIPGMSPDTCSLSVRTIFVHELPKGATVGYGAEWVAARPTIAAVLPIGFADGFSMQPASLTRGWRGVKTSLINLISRRSPYVTFGTHKAPLLGRIAMQMIVVDVTDLPTRVKVGDIAVVPVRRLAVSSRIPRIPHESLT